MNQYQELRNRQQKEVNALSIGQACTRQQFNELMRGWGLAIERDNSKVFHIGAGRYIQKKDAHLLEELKRRHHQELQDAIAADKTGSGFIRDMFCAELTAHEYGFTKDETDALEALEYTRADIEADKRLSHGFALACKTFA